ncbi:amino acid ABC transporter permease [Pseudorhodoferax sp. Leaf265]|jgi:polar amino acid transport system permease protein|uniref:amino acid ABC transporter permease n=1 Tax=Pseudorhodoferax sp. Leaf265 TaxID=1736315 RepID=UPI0006FA7126|nr:amino acid ABC transporter permease [Pseudorhodoferax sp. Leaf265]KQP19622.1 polar amino acid ABC transporter permease [Pseudorhodoferax sp. Leaf265]PZP92876.1 MAG: amino acid ABC transporter permease [Variovorax paradoxus]PZQ03547.1 MAG: amino acid ABC transporter permease [Variovorax paradoxus]
MDTLIDTFFNLEIYRQVFPYLLGGLWTTVWLSAIVIPLGAGAGLLLALAQTQSPARWARWSVIAYVDFFRAFPPLVLLIFLYFGLPFLVGNVPKLGAVVLAFVLNNASYFCEVFRAGIQSVPRGQMEAARSTGLTRLQALRHVVLPQAVRNVMPDLLGNCIEVVKLTTIASVVGMPELLRAARDTQSLVYNPSPIVLAALLYLAMLWPLTRVLASLEKRRAGMAGH